MDTLNLISLSEVHHIKPSDRLFESINTFLIILSAIAHASSLVADGQTHKLPRPTLRLNTKKLGYAFVIPLRGPLEIALRNQLPDSIDIGVTALAEANTPISGPKIHTGGLDNVMTHIISPVFLTFFERYNTWLNENLGKAKDWPPTLNFARVIRNAAAHGSITFRNLQAPAVEWYGFRYGPRDNGKKIIGPDIRMGDILGLMFETNKELDRLNVPIL